MIINLRSGLWLLLALLRIFAPEQALLAVFILLTILFTQHWSWIKLRSGKIALFILILAVILPNHWTTVWHKLMPYVDVIIMLVSLNLLRSAIANSAISQILSQWLTQHRRPWITLGVSVGISPIFNMGTIPILLAGLSKKELTNNREIPNIVARGVATANLLAPTSAPVLLTLSMFPAISWFSVMSISLFAIVIMIALIGLNAYRSNHLFSNNINIIKEITPPDISITNINRWKSLLPVIIFLGTLLTLSIILHKPYSQSIFIACFITWFSSSIINNHSDLFQLINIAQTKLLPELILFIACGILAIRLYDIFEGIQIGIFSQIPVYLTSFLICILLLIVMPLVCRIGLHPIIPFCIVAPLISPLTNEISLPIIITLWLCYWVQSLIISPSSVINLTVNATLGDNSWYKPDLRFLFISSSFLTLLFVVLIEMRIMY
ncbi:MULTISPECIES: hypothetical protein [Acinetobacter]|uniref:Uncharacterized protein n=3 Tax=Acinetobacter TaxID=469 RepID=A0A365PFV0_ACIJU|nr:MULTISPECIES: hypothetical protein [Acinetobacter]USI86030.1 hypothetical protein LZ086_12010 [Acinetobacter johnsonii]ENU84128.1 hypothetical protein F974_00826 [Acinetobacter sp. CIP 102159]ENX25012.1 hypothetical protein F893_00383 [Acinetobacter sp. CIP 102136]ENX64124.1 hypothetical protein F884_01799 [Acinetobacter sp. CIP 102143]EPG35727.1 hypothetical protein F907_03105 [Acinetobacter colistiniresistens]